MRSFEAYNPIALAVYFISVSGFAMLCMNPIILLISLTGAVSLFLIQNGKRNIGSHFGFFGLFLIMSLINPLFSHNGKTVLFVLNNSPITLEAVFYGASASGMIVSVLYWFRSFSRIMTEDKLLYIFGGFSPKLALVLSMGLRYVPLFRRQTKKTSAAQTAVGLYKDGNIIDSTRGGIRVFSVMLTWALENGIVTADSMAARGYGVGKRTNFSNYRFRSSDIVFTVVTLVFASVVCISIGMGALDFAFYPEVRASKITLMSYIGYIFYLLLAFLPIFIETEERIRWKYLSSKI